MAVKPELYQPHIPGMIRKRQDNGARGRQYLLVFVPGDVRLRAVNDGEVTILPIFTLRHDFVAILHTSMSLC